MGRLSDSSDSLFRGKGFPRTSAGNYDVENLLLQNVGVPISPQDAATKQYADGALENLKQQLTEWVKTVEGKSEKLEKSFQAGKYALENLKHQLTERVKTLEEKSEKLRRTFLDHVAHVEQVILQWTPQDGSMNEIIRQLKQINKRALEDMEGTPADERELDSQVL